MSTNKDGQQSSLDEEQLAELREIFRSYDRNNDGSLTQLELRSLLRSLGMKPTQDQLDALIQRADINSNGLVEFSEFVALVSPEILSNNCPYSKDQLKQLFEMFDRDGIVTIVNLIWQIKENIINSDINHGKSKLFARVADLLIIYYPMLWSGNGYITAAELAHSMAKLGHALTAEELTGMIKEADTDGDGQISFQEFAHAITAAAFDNSWPWLVAGVKTGYVYCVLFLFLGFDIFLIVCWGCLKAIVLCIEEK